MTTPSVAPKDSHHELLSALFDGQAGSGLALADMPLFDSGDALGSWNAYQLIGESLCAQTSQLSTSAALGADPAFLQRLNEKLEREEIEKPTPLRVVSAPSVILSQPAAAANDGQYRWKLVAGFASLAAVLAVAWNVAGTGLGSSASQLAQSGAAQATVVVTQSPAGPMIRDARLEELLSAHKQFGATTLQVPSGFVRNASLDTSGR